MYCMNSTQAAKYIGIGVNRIRELAKAKEIPAIRTGKQLRFYRPLLEEWAENKARNNEQI